MSVKMIDGFVVTAIESLKAEWLYSQGRGRQFRVGEQVALARYLSTVCPLSGEALENENERKLRLILSKAQQHQRQLQEQSSGGGGDGTTTPVSNSPSSLRRKGQSRIQSPRGTLKKLHCVSNINPEHQSDFSDSTERSSALAGYHVQ